MPRRMRIDIEDIAAWPNLESALWAAARGKRTRPDVAAFLNNAPTALANVREALLAGRLPVGTFYCFAILVVGKPSRGTCPWRLCLARANRKGAGASVGVRSAGWVERRATRRTCAPNARRWPGFLGAMT
jgi:hypothetical protein